MPGPKHGEVERCAAHLGAVDAHQPRSIGPVAQQQRVFAVVRRVLHPSPTARFPFVRSVAAVEYEPLVVVSARVHRPNRHVGQRRGSSEEAFGFGQPALTVIEGNSRSHFRA